MQALRIFEHLQFLGRANFDVAVRADAEPPTRVEERPQRKYAVAQVRLGKRAQAGHGAALPERDCFRRVHMGRVDEAPSLVKRFVVEQPLHRPRPRPRQAIVNLACLLGDMNMDGAVRRERDDVRQVL